MSLIDKMYQGIPLPSSTNPAKIKQIHDHLMDRMEAEIKKKHMWFASAYNGVQAGVWRGDRLAKRRRKLLRLINECRVHLDLLPIEPPKDWEYVNLYYGFGAYHKYEKETGLKMTIAASFFTTMIDTSLNSNDGRYFQSAKNIEVIDQMAQKYLRL